MTGIEARDFVLERIKDYLRTHPKDRSNAMKLSWELAMDLTKLTRDQIGSFADEFAVLGTAALQKHGLYGYTVDIDWQQDGHVVDFGVS